MCVCSRIRFGVQSAYHVWYRIFRELAVPLFFLRFSVFSVIARLHFWIFHGCLTSVSSVFIVFLIIISCLPLIPKKKTKLKRRNREERERFLSDCLPYRRTGQGRTGKRREEPIRTGKTSAAHSNALDIDVYSRNRPRICKP